MDRNILDCSEEFFGKRIKAYKEEKTLKEYQEELANELFEMFRAIHVLGMVKGWERSDMMSYLVKKLSKEGWTAEQQIGTLECFKIYLDRLNCK